MSERRFSYGRIGTHISSHSTKAAAMDVAAEYSRRGWRTTVVRKGNQYDVYTLGAKNIPRRARY